MAHIRRVETPAPPDCWDRLHKSDPLAVPYQSRAWFETIRTATGKHDASRHYLMDDGREFVLPLVRSRHLPAAAAIVESPPSAWGMGGLICSDGLTPADVTAVMTDLAALGHLRVSIRPNPLLGDTWAAGIPVGVHATPRLAHVVDLRPGFDHLWRKEFAHAVRKGVKKAERNGVELEVATGTSLLPIYRQLFDLSVERWASQQREPLALARIRARRRDPQKKLEAMVAGTGDACRIWVAWHDGEPASALITIEAGHAVQAVKSAMNKDLAGPLHTNDLIYTRLIEQACDAGFGYYHLGESGQNPHLAAFKRRFGASGHEYAEYCVERLPLTAADAAVRRVVKRAIGFKDY